MILDRYSKEQINEYRAQWLAQLRSPKAKKAKGKLEDPENPDQRCCLGHACHIFGLQRAIRRTEYGAVSCVFYGGGDGEASWLPYEARQKLNISLKGSFKADVEVDGITVNALSVVNDYTRLSLPQIADLIEEQFEADNFLPCETF